MKVWLQKSLYDYNGYLLFFNDPQEGINCLPSQIPWLAATAWAMEAGVELPTKREEIVSFLVNGHKG